MLSIYPESDVPKAQGKTIWWDVRDPSPAEVAEVKKAAGIEVPSRKALSEIETSSRLKARDGVLSMSVPMVTHAGGYGPQIAPIGFILSREHLITVRFAVLPAFDAVAARFTGSEERPGSSLEVFVDLCDELIDRLADGLEEVATELRDLSTTAFHVPEGQGRKAVRSNKLIRARLRQLGRLGDYLSEKRDALLGLGRAIDFACELTSDWAGGKLKPRMAGLKQDVASLDNYEVHLSDKVQFLLDAMVGLIGIAQNDIFKILTIVSIVGIPPTLIAGIYGMNFKFMPEYDWLYGYPYGLALIVLSAIVPLVWFKWRGWF
ncbi:magnesium transporter CorA family protein [Mesorhizobium huakuii]|uniref:Magnesium transporter CorA family protein n=1 Tax=Mesorhizobium huakuii TaxID=28104 RepID=A0A7G6T1L7_9HYPH|nr:magnesium transporter CorA family protein [Mesorhizobium huakuii]QND60649.1 magnesium transporter CorA family protein [Mesorhizobium huakuii]